VATVDSSLTLSRGLRLLRIVCESSDGVSVTDAAAALKTHRQGIYRLLRPLLEQRFVVRGADNRYRPGLGLMELITAIRPRLQQLAAPRLAALADELRATSLLLIRDGDDAVLIFVAEPRDAGMHLAFRPGTRYKLDQGAAGVALLSGEPARSEERIAVSEARVRGYALTSGELWPGVTGVAAPISHAGLVEATVSAMWTGERDPTAAGEAIKKLAAELSNALA
jgi:DNA-binding IclR family transcriptional regulator